MYNVILSLLDVDVPTAIKGTRVVWVYELVRRLGFSHIDRMVARKASAAIKDGRVAGIRGLIRQTLTAIKDDRVDWFCELVPRFGSSRIDRTKANKASAASKDDRAVGSVNWFDGEAMYITTTFRKVYGVPPAAARNHQSAIVQCTMLYAAELTWR